MSSIKNIDKPATNKPDTFNSGTTERAPAQPVSTGNSTSNTKTNLNDGVDHSADNNKMKVFEFHTAADEASRKLTVKLPVKDSPTEGAARQKLQSENPGMTIGNLVNSYEE